MFPKLKLEARCERVVLSANALVDGAELSAFLAAGGTLDSGGFTLNVLGAILLPPGGCFKGGVFYGTLPTKKK